MADSPLTPAIEASFEELAATVPATIGIAIARPDLAEVCSLGRWSSGVAWSTIKVPLAIAALRGDAGRARDLVVKAITESDNHASEQLWSQLGEPAGAAGRVQAVINESGDAATVVESQRLRRGYTPFGQTHWTLAGQARFAAQLPGIAHAATVIDLMRRLTADHRWGLAAKGIAAKGGWGPGVRDDYLVRQFGIAPTDYGHVGLALAAQAHAFEAGVDVLDAMTAWLVDQLPAITAR
jgi:Beta-lactamase enzyme family